MENLPVVSRAIEIWPTIEMYGDGVSQKKLPVLLYDGLAAARQDPLILAKFHFYMANAILTKYQTDEPVLPFISQDSNALIKVMN